MKSLMRLTTVLVVLVIVALMLVAFVIGGKPSSEERKVLLLGNTPVSYCPTKAEIVITQSDSKKVVVDELATVENCNILAIWKYLSWPAGEYTLYIKTESALAFSIRVALPVSQSIQSSLLVGDTNGDNVIDSIDEKAINSRLFLSPVQGAGISTDVNGDDLVDITDLSLARLNAGVGVQRPDNRPWMGSIE
jgi:hypothetical protein